MATTPQYVTEASAGAPSAAAGEGPPAPVDALHPHGRLRRRARDPDHRARRGLVRLRRERQALPRRPLGAVLRERRSRPRRDGRGGRPPVGEARLLHQLELRPPHRDRAGRANRRPHAGRPQPRLLHLGRLRGRGVGLEALAPVPQAQRRADAHQDHLARDGLPRHHLRRALDHRDHSSAHGLRAARTGRPSRAQHQRLPLARGPRPALGRRPDRAHDRVPGPRDGGRGDPRAGAELGRLPTCPRTATGSGCARSATATACC